MSTDYYLGCKKCKSYVFFFKESAGGLRSTPPSENLQLFASTHNFLHSNENSTYVSDTLVVFSEHYLSSHPAQGYYLDEDEIDWNKAEIITYADISCQGIKPTENHIIVKGEDDIEEAKNFIELMKSFLRK